MYTAQLAAARARETNAKLALGLVIDGENTAVAQLVAQLDNAKWELEQTMVHAPDDGVRLKDGRGRWRPRAAGALAHVVHRHR